MMGAWPLRCLSSPECFSHSAFFKQLPELPLLAAQHWQTYLRRSWTNAMAELSA
jgi:hypothetical protein